MPSRWRLPNTRVSQDQQPGKTETTQPPKWDDFCFVDEPIPPIRDTPLDERPNTSSGVPGGNRSTPSTNYAAYSPSKLEGGMIGVAFGSPTHPPAICFGNLNDLAPPSTYEESLFEQASPMYQIKGRTSKWKKLGSLFKGGKFVADKDDISEIPFYKVRVEDHSSEVVIETRGRRLLREADELPARKSPTPPPKDNRRRSIDARLASARLEVARLEEAIAAATKKSVDYAEEKPDDASRPKLDLVIPNFKMDRYSVMFADIKEIPPHSKLLVRRSKKLDRLKPMSMEDMNQIDKATTPDTSTLSPRLALPRRATSPSASKPTGGFSLFPAAALTPNYLTRSTLNISSPQVQLKRSVTSPARLSPRAEMFGTIKSKPSDTPRADNSNTVISPGNTTASTDHGAPWSAEALLSPTSTATTIDEDILLSPARSNKKNEHEQRYPDPNEAHYIQFFASPTLPLETGATPEATTPFVWADASQDDDCKIQRVASSVFDAAIAEIEAFGLPSLQEQPPLPSPPSAYVPFVLASDDKLTDSIERPPPALSRSRLMMMNMPSPISEAPEESPGPSPAKPRPIVTKSRFKITALPQISEAKQRAPPGPIRLEIPPMRKARRTLDTAGPNPAAVPSSIPEVMVERPSFESEKPRLQAAPVQREQIQVQNQRQNGEQKDLAVQPSPAKRQPQPQTSPQQPKQDLQTSPLRNGGRSNSRQRTNDKAATVLGKSLPAAPRQKATPITTQAASPPTSPSETPPAVPKKDSKFILPLSRFAVKGTAAEVAQKTGLQASPNLAPPAKPIRSVTEPLSTEYMTNSYPRSKYSRLVRSASDESLRRDVTKPLAKGAATNALQRMGMERSNDTAVTAVVKPVPVTAGGEVGVARTISLSRKASQRILVRKGDGTSTTPVGGWEASSEAQAMKIRARNDHQIMASALRPPRSSSRPNGPLNKLKRSESFKRAIEVGIDDEEEGDMRSGEFLKRAMSPDVREVMPGLVVNGHKVMKSSVGVIEEA